MNPSSVVSFSLDRASDDGRQQNPSGAAVELSEAQFSEAGYLAQAQERKEQEPNARVFDSHQLSPWDAKKAKKAIEKPSVEADINSQVVVERVIASGVSIVPEFLDISDTRIEKATDAAAQMKLKVARAMQAKKATDAAEKARKEVDAAIEAAKARKKGAQVKFLAQASATMERSTDGHWRNGVFGSLSGRAELGARLSRELNAFDDVVNVISRNVSMKIQQFEAKLSRLPYVAILNGSYRNEEADEIFSLIGLLLSLDDVSDHYLNFTNSLYVFYDDVFPRHLLYPNPLTDAVKRQLLTLLCCPIYWGQGRRGRCYDHEGFALGHELAEAQGRAPPKTTSAFIHWLKCRFAARKPVTRIQVYTEHHPLLCWLSETAMLTYLKGSMNVACGTLMKTLSPDLYDFPGERPILHFLGAYTLSQLVHRKWNKIETVTQEDARVGKYAVSYFTRMNAGPARNSTLQVVEGESDGQNVLLSSADLARRRYYRDYPDREGATTNELLPQVLSELLADPEFGGAVLETELCRAMLEKRDKENILAVPTMIDKYALYLRHRVDLSKDFKSRDGVIIRAYTEGGHKNKYSEDAQTYRAVAFIHMHFPYVTFKPEDLYDIYVGANQAHGTKAVFTKKLSQILHNFTDKAHQTRFKGFLTRLGWGHYATTEWKNLAGLQSLEEYETELRGTIVRVVGRQQRSTARSLTDVLDKEYPGYYGTCDPAPKNIRLWLLKYLKKMTYEPYPLIRRDTSIFPEWTFKLTTAFDRPVNRPLRPRGGSYWDAIEFVNDVLANTLDHHLTRGQIISRLLKDYDLQNEEELTAAFGSFAVEEFDYWYFSGELLYDEDTDTYYIE